MIVLRYDLTDRLQQYQNNAWGNSNSTINSGLNNGSIFSPNNMQSLNLNASSALYPQQNSFSTYSQPYYSQPYYLAQNTNTITSKKLNNQPYIFSDEMRERLGFLESRGNYHAHNTSGGGIGALGKYQIRRDGLIDAGYLNSDNQWLGKNSIYSQDDFFNNPDKQEQVLNDYLKSNYRQLKNKGSLNYIGNQVEGIAGVFNITDTGLLAASHREGAGAVNRYLNNLEKNQNNSYYMNYNKITNPELTNMFKRIETRLRKFEK